MPDIEYDDFVKFSFFKVDRSWRALPEKDRRESKEEFAAIVDELTPAASIRTFSTVGTRAEVDFMLLQSAPTVDTFHEVASRINGSRLAQFLEQPHSYLSIRRKSRYKHGGGAPKLKEDYRYFIVYPMTKTRSWYEKSMEERQKMMNDHFRVGHKYPTVKINTTYAFGLDDSEFVVAFEMDDPSDFTSLVMDLREVPAAQYTLSETPIFTTIRMPVRDALNALG